MWNFKAISLAIGASCAIGCGIYKFYKVIEEKDSIIQFQEKIINKKEQEEEALKYTLIEHQKELINEMNEKLSLQDCIKELEFIVTYT